MAVGWAYDEDDECWYHAAEDSLGADKGWFPCRRRLVLIPNIRCTTVGTAWLMRINIIYENGQMAANQYVEMNYYDENGLRDKQYDITIQGKRRPTAEEKKGITEPWKESQENGSANLMSQAGSYVFTDKKYYSAPDRAGDLLCIS